MVQLGLMGFNMTLELAVAVISLWDTKQLMLKVPESDIERTIHIRKEASRGVVPC